MFRVGAGEPLGSWTPWRWGSSWTLTTCSSMHWRRRRGGTWCISWTRCWCPRCRGCGGRMPSRWLGGGWAWGWGLGWLVGAGVGSWWKVLGGPLVLQKLGSDGQNWRGGVWWICFSQEAQVSQVRVLNSAEGRQYQWKAKHITSYLGFYKQ